MEEAVSSEDIVGIVGVAVLTEMKEADMHILINAVWHN